MARARLLKPGFFKNEDLALLSAHHRLLFAGLWTLADREGRLEDRVERIKVEIFPYEPEISAARIDAMCNELHIGAFIVRYGVRGGAGRVTRYIAIPTFLDHQTPHHREPPSRIPAPPSRLVKSQAQTRAKTRIQPRALSQAAPDPSLSDPVTGDPVPETESVTGDPEALSGVGFKSSPAKAGRAASGENGRPEEKNLGVITKIAHEALDLVWAKSGDLPDVVKSLCGERGIAYDSSVVRKAIESAEAQRRHT